MSDKCIFQKIQRIEDSEQLVVSPKTVAHRSVEFLLKRKLLNGENFLLNFSLERRVIGHIENFCPVYKKREGECIIFLIKSRINKLKMDQIKILLNRILSEV